jgi:ABC-type Mn2+/Zn2+ transport system permease subunit
VIGLLLSYHLNLASGPAIVLVETALFGLAFVLSPRRRSRLRPAT